MAVTYEQKVDCLHRLHCWIYGESESVSPSIDCFGDLSWLLGRAQNHDTFNLHMAAVLVKQYDMVVVLENDGFIWIGDYEKIAQEIEVNSTHYIEKIY